VRPDTALLLAIPTLLLAVAVLVGAGVMVVVSHRARASLREQRAQASRMVATVGREAPAVRERLARMSGDLDRLDQSGAALAGKMETWKADLAKRRGSLEQLSRGRIDPAARLLRVVSLATRVAILWR
jgi:septal ring factor EnvC (AmiA/AmiB activator)